MATPPNAYLLVTFVDKDIGSEWPIRCASVWEGRRWKEFLETCSVVEDVQLYTTPSCIDNYDNVNRMAKTIRRLLDDSKSAAEAVIVNATCQIAMLDHELGA